MNVVVGKALPLWGLAGADYALVAARENAVYRIKTPKVTYAMRLHRKGYRSDDELGSELHWMKAVHDGGVHVPIPITSLTGDVMHVVDSIQVDVLTWMDGNTLDAILAQSDASVRIALFYALGQNMARLHEISDAWKPPAGFTRCAWDVDGLVGETPIWDRFWDNPALTIRDRDLLIALRHRAQTDLQDLLVTSDYGLVHADLVAANVIADGTSLCLIDFDDGGYGFRIFEIATALLKHIDAPDYSTLKRTLIDGYASVRAVDLAPLDLFMALRAATYVGWNITRMDEDNGMTRNTRFIQTATKLAMTYVG